MCDSKNKDLETFIDEKNVKLVLSASKDLKKDLSKALDYNKDQMWKLLNALLLLAGIYITLLIFVCNSEQNKSLPIFWPPVLSGFFLIFAFVLSIIEIFPTPSMHTILPKEMYKLTFKKYEESLYLLIPTYLDSVNKVWINVEEKNLSRKKIILFFLSSVLNFILFGIFCITYNYKMYINVISVILSIIFMIIYFYFSKNERIRINKLMNKLREE